MNRYEAEYPLNDIQIGADRRPVNAEAVARLVESIAALGLRVPPTVRMVEATGGEPDTVMLVTGRHRLEAVRQLGWDKIPCVVYDSDDEVEAQLWEIAETFHREELTTIEKAAQLKRWMELVSQRGRCNRAAAKTGAEADDGNCGPLVHNSGAGRPSTPRSEAAKELNLHRKEAERLALIATLPPEALARAEALGLGDNKTALVQAAKSDNPMASLEDHAKDLAARKAARKSKAVATPRESTGETEATEPAEPAPTVASARPAPEEDESIPPWEEIEPPAMPVEDNVIQLPVTSRFRPHEAKELTFSDREALKTIRNNFALLEPEAQVPVFLALWDDASMEVKACVMEAVRQQAERRHRG